MIVFNTVHVFGFGTSQLITETVNKKTPSSGLTTLDSFVAHIVTFKPEDIALTDYHVIHVFNNYEVRYLGSALKSGFGGTKDSWSVKWADLDLAIVGALIDEIAAK